MSWSTDDEYMDMVRDIMENPVFRTMERYIQHGHTTCLEHCIRVSYRSYRLCRRWGWDARDAARGGLLHDFYLYDWHTHARETGKHFHGFTHPRTAAENAVRCFDVTEREKNIILRHMWPLTLIPPRHREGFAVVCEDKLCGLEETAAAFCDWILIRIHPT